MTSKAFSNNIQRSCGVLYFHFFFGVALVILGWTTFAARWLPRLKPYHRTMGQIWAYGMIVQVYCSTYVSYNGYMWFVFMFGVICYGSLITGHTFIRKFQRNRELRSQNGRSLMANEMQAIGQELDKESDANPVSSPDSGIGKIEKSCWTQALLKKLHGTFMVLSLIMLTGAGAAFTRRFATTSTCVNIYCSNDYEGPLPLCFN
eukprot:CAMPEP_0197031600 /NCGR_PEP_ID=MMETSP1384-20130603/10565_1 /TAXON_ID=29189 /ORGANISM="Ammonia sp." /LENGTH=203 /DNA_ID=CAMNT_0042461155 /DNA_START=72 /DNA_END=683 /DNA_ORIENTATION=+